MFSTIQKALCHFHQIQNCRLQTLSIWRGLKFVIWERVKLQRTENAIFDLAAILFNGRYRVYFISLWIIWGNIYRKKEKSAKMTSNFRRPFPFEINISPYLPQAEGINSISSMTENIIYFLGLFCLQIQWNKKVVPDFRHEKIFNVFGKYPPFKLSLSITFLKIDTDNYI